MLQTFQTQDVKSIIRIFFDRMLTLTNQILQGGTSYNSTINRPQLKGSGQILMAFWPALLLVWIENSDILDLGQVFYAVKMS